MKLSSLAGRGGGLIGTDLVLAQPHALSQADREGGPTFGL